MKRNENSLRDLWDNIKHTNIWVIRVPEEEEKEKEPEKISEEIIGENFPNMGKEIVTQVQEAQTKAKTYNQDYLVRISLIFDTEIKSRQKSKS